MRGFRFRFKDHEVSEFDERRVTCIKIWNYALMLRRKYYEWYGKYLSDGKLKKFIAKKRAKDPYWSKVNSHWIYKVLDDQDLSYKKFFDKDDPQKRPPKFKSFRKDYSFCAVFRKDDLFHGCRIENDELVLIQGKGAHNEISGRKFIKHGWYPLDRVKSVRIKKHNYRWYLCICCDDENPRKVARDCYGTAGLDFGLKTFITLPDGTKIVCPRFLWRNIRKLRRLSRALSRKVKGSKGYERAKKALALFHTKVANQRDAWQWRQTHALCKRFDIIKVEDLTLKGWQRLWGRKASDMAIGEFIKKLKHVAPQYGTTIVMVDKWFPSSHLCSACGDKLDRKLNLNERCWTCPICFVKHDRDVNAAVNLMNWEPNA